MDFEGAYWKVCSDFMEAKRFHLNIKLKSRFKNITKH